jgi:predicted dithiol-disulfide oxidoreductase (DUF899 family)
LPHRRPHRHRYSGFATRFHEDFVGAEGASFGLSVFLCKGDAIFQTGFSSGRGIELPTSTFGLLDVTRGIARTPGRIHPTAGRSSPPGAR